MSDGDIVLDFLTNLCGLSLSAALPKVKGFLAAGVRTRAALFALTEGELKDKCGITHAAQRKKVRAAHVRAVPGECWCRLQVLRAPRLLHTVLARLCRNDR